MQYSDVQNSPSGDSRASNSDDANDPSDDSRASTSDDMTKDGEEAFKDFIVAEFGVENLSDACEL